VKLYEDAHVYTLLTPPSDYEEEAAVYLAHLRHHLGTAPFQLLELGCGPGHNAMWFANVQLTLVDRSPTMLARAQDNLPHAVVEEGDMRSVRLGRTFDAVFVHDAVCHLTTLDDIQALMHTIAAHLRPGGCALIVPDYVQETFATHTECGGSDDGEEGVRYLSWVWQAPDQTTTYTVDYVVMHRQGTAPPAVFEDRHLEGLFSKQAWLDAMTAAGLDARVVHQGGIGDDTAFFGVLPV